MKIPNKRPLPKDSETLDFIGETIIQVDELHPEENYPGIENIMKHLGAPRAEGSRLFIDMLRKK